MPTDHLKSLLDTHGLRPVFQPIVSLKEKKVVGFEALSRCVAPQTGDLLPPARLFAAAREAGLSMALDRLCRDRAMRAFGGAGLSNRHTLFLNFDPSILGRVAMGNGWMLRNVERMGMTPQRVAIEIVESRVTSQEELLAFVEKYRSYGFLIVLDDFGAQHSNLDRILLLRPDIVKIDRELIHGVADDFYRQSVVGSIVGLADRIGTLTLAEGVETFEDILTCYELGINLFQGFHFARPAPPSEMPRDGFSGAISSVFGRVYGHLNAQVKERVRTQKIYDRLAKELCETLVEQSAARFGTILRRRIGSLSGVQCIYVLRRDGRQVGETVCAEGERPCANHPFFTPSAPGTDHSLKPYYYYLRILGLPRFFTDPYTSLATGTVCRTLSAGFDGAGGEPFILCVDVDARFPDNRVRLKG